MVIHVELDVLPPAEQIVLMDAQENALTVAQILAMGVTLVHQVVQAVAAITAEVVVVLVVLDVAEDVLLAATEIVMEIVVDV